MKIRKNEYALCMPLTGKDSKALEDQINDGIIKKVDFFEWRRDYFRPEEGQPDGLKKIRDHIKERGLIYTFRSEREGGVATLSDQERLDHILAAIKTGLVDYIDIELINKPFVLEEIEKEIKKTTVKKILSYHDFNQIPAGQRIIELFDQMLVDQADVLKLAVRPWSKDDLRRLIRLTLDYSGGIKQPIILIAMGALGKITRVAPEICGGSLSFAGGKQKTAPGQLSVEEIRAQRKALGLD